MPAAVSRRTFLRVATAGALLAACDDVRQAISQLPAFDDGEGRLTARPGEDQPRNMRPGQRSLGITSERDALLYVPPEARGGRRVPLLVSLHGAGGGSEGLGRFRFAADRGVAMLVPYSSGPTWDRTFGAFGEDVEMIDRALAATFRRVPIDTERIALAGFSDGASYALSLGLTNGDLFGFVIACSPGYFAPGELQGRPDVFISHGTDDRVLPIDQTSREIVPLLRDADYDVTFVTFHGRHEVPPQILRRAITWFLRSAG
jgi:phospholipase/carboxylesterase